MAPCFEQIIALFNDLQDELENRLESIMKRVREIPALS